MLISALGGYFGWIVWTLFSGATDTGEILFYALALLAAVLFGIVGLSSDARALTLRHSKLIALFGKVAIAIALTGYLVSLIIASTSEPDYIVARAVNFACLGFAAIGTIVAILPFYARMNNVWQDQMRHLMGGGRKKR
jgi:hypothetical protein